MVPGGWFTVQDTHLVHGPGCISPDFRTVPGGWFQGSRCTSASIRRSPMTDVCMLHPYNHTHHHSYHRERLLRGYLRARASPDQYPYMQ